MKDPILDEVRAVREAYAAQFDFDLKAIYKDLKKKQEDRCHSSSLPKSTSLTQ